MRGQMAGIGAKRSPRPSASAAATMPILLLSGSISNWERNNIRAGSSKTRPQSLERFAGAKQAEKWGVKNGYSAEPSGDCVNRPGVYAGLGPISKEEKPRSTGLLAETASATRTEDLSAVARYARLGEQPVDTHICLVL